MKYLARKYGLSALNDPAVAKEEMLLFQIQDFSHRLVQTAFYNQPYKNDEDFQAEMVQLTNDMHTHLELLEKFFPSGEGDIWLTGTQLSYVDFFAYEIIQRYQELVQPDCLSAIPDKYPKLAVFMTRFESLEPLRDYLASDEYKKAKIFGPNAKIGSTRR